MVSFEATINNDGTDVWRYYKLQKKQMGVIKF